MVFWQRKDQPNQAARFMHAEFGFMLKRFAVFAFIHGEHETQQLTTLLFTDPILDETLSALGDWLRDGVGGGLLGSFVADGIVGGLGDRKSVV